MQNKSYATLFIVCLVSVVYALETRWENVKLRTDNLMKASEIDLLNDQCREYEYNLTSRPTYEEGYQAALIRQSNGNYLEGYADAKKQFDSANSYAVGYHAAIAQFGLLKTVDNEAIKKIDPVSTAEKAY